VCKLDSSTDVSIMQKLEMCVLYIVQLSWFAGKSAHTIMIHKLKSLQIAL